MGGRTDLARPILLGRDKLLREVAAIRSDVRHRRDLDLRMTDAFVVDLDELSAVLAEACDGDAPDREGADARPPRVLLRRRA